METLSRVTSSHKFFTFTVTQIQQHGTRKTPLLIQGNVQCCPRLIRYNTTTPVKSRKQRKEILEVTAYSMHEKLPLSVSARRRFQREYFCTKQKIFLGE